MIVVWMKCDETAEFRTPVLAESWPPEEWCDVTPVVAVSGGPDSVALLRALAALKNAAAARGGLIVGHFNHRLRPQADDDAGFVADAGEAAGFAVRAR